MKNLLVLGAGVDQCFMIRTAKKMGLNVVAVDMNSNAPGFKYADHSLLVSNRDIDAVVNSVKEKNLNIGGVSTMGSDIPHIVARLANHFGTPSIPLRSAEITVNKYEMKQVFRDNGITVPDFKLVSSLQEVESLLQQWQVIVIKPLSQAGSRGVFLINQETPNIAEIFSKSIKFSGDGTLLVEKYCPGDQLSSESLIVNGEVVTPGYADRNYDVLEKFLPQIMENGGWVPSKYDERKKDVDEVIGLCAEALGIKDGVIKGDLVFMPTGEVCVIEVAARLSGGDFSESLVPLSSGVNYVEQVIRQALGEPVELEKLIPKKNSCIANRYFFPPAGRLNRVDGVEVARTLPYLRKFELWYKEGDVIPEIDGHGARGGVFVIEGRDRSEVQARVDHVYSTVQFQVESK